MCRLTPVTCGAVSLVSDRANVIGQGQGQHNVYCALARKLRDAAAVLFGLKFADNIHYKVKSIAKLRKPGFRAPDIPAHCSAIERFKIIQGHVFQSQWKGDKGLHNAI